MQPRKYPFRMQPEQRIIASWMRRVMELKGWSAQEWADEVGFSATNVTRAMKEGYQSVTSIRTLDQLAKAAKVPSVLGFLASQPRSTPINVNDVTAVLRELLGSSGEWKESDAPHLAEALLYGLGLAASDPATPASEETLKVAGRAAADRLHDSKTGA